jgi:hypothetical protein
MRILKKITPLVLAGMIGLAGCGDTYEQWTKGESLKTLQADLNNDHLVDSISIHYRTDVEWGRRYGYFMINIFVNNGAGYNDPFVGCKIQPADGRSFLESVTITDIDYDLKPELVYTNPTLLDDRIITDPGFVYYKTVGNGNFIGPYFMELGQRMDLDRSEFEKRLYEKIKTHQYKIIK